MVCSYFCRTIPALTCLVVALHRSAALVRLPGWRDEDCAVHSTVERDKEGSQLGVTLHERDLDVGSHEGGKYRIGCQMG